MENKVKSFVTFVNEEYEVPEELKTGDKDVDELTKHIHDPETPAHLVKHLEELRGIKSTKGESTSRNKNYDRNVYDKNKMGELPSIEFGTKKFDLGNGWKLELMEWSHPGFKKGESFPIIYVEDKDGNIYFTKDANYYGKDVFDGKKLKNIDNKYYINDTLVSGAIYYLYGMSTSCQMKPVNLFNSIKNAWYAEETSSRYNREPPEGQKFLENKFGKELINKIVKN